MQSLNEKYEPKFYWKKEMRLLKVKGKGLQAPLEKRKSLQSMAAKMKKVEGLTFEIRKVNESLIIWRLK